MNTTNIVHLDFNPDHNALSTSKELRDGLSGVVWIGDSLWVANDETISLERLSLVKGASKDRVLVFGDHKQFQLDEYLRLPSPRPQHPAIPEEADLEGLAYDGAYLWLVGSHSLKRKNPQLAKGVHSAQRQLAKVSSDGNHFLLARIPVVCVDGVYLLAKEGEQIGEKRTAAQLHGNDKGNDLLAALTKDEHLGPFLAIPGKDNGFDIEGLAVAGKRLFIGLRGPVLRGWAVILEIELEDDSMHSVLLRLKAIGPNARCYRKHFLHLGGLGIRDLCRQGKDLLILAGPTMDLDGPVTIWRWVGGTEQAEECMVPLGELERVLDVPYGQGDDHAEGMTLFAPDGGADNSLLVVYDAVSKKRLLGVSSVVADVFPVVPTNTTNRLQEGGDNRE